MPGQHSPGYLAARARATRIAARHYRDEHPDQWQQILDDELWKETWPRLQSDRGVIEAMAATDDPARTEAEYRWSWEVGQRVMARPDFLAKTRAKMAELDRKHGKAT